MPALFRAALPAAGMAVLVLAISGCAHFPKTLLVSDPLSPEEHVALAAAYRNEKRQDLAKREYQAALKKDKKFAPAVLGLGNIEFEGENWKKAEKYYVRALKISRGHPGASNNLAMVYVRQGRRLDQAEKLIQEALANSGNLRPYLLDTLANVYLAQGDVSRAGIAASQAWREGPQSDPQFASQFAKTLEKFPQEEANRLQRIYGPTEEAE